MNLSLVYKIYGAFHIISALIVKGIISWMLPSWTSDDQFKKVL